MKIISFIEDEEVIGKIFKYLGLWEVKIRPPPRVKTPVRIHPDDSESQILRPCRRQVSSTDSFYADPDYPVDHYRISKPHRATSLVSSRVARGNFTPRSSQIRT
jgi:hypothetical protein